MIMSIFALGQLLSGKTCVDRAAAILPDPGRIKGNFSIFNHFIADSLEKIKDVSIPTTVFSASLLYGRRIFVCGGDDFKLYKYNYDDGTEIGKL